MRGLILLSKCPTHFHAFCNTTISRRKKLIHGFFSSECQCIENTYVEFLQISGFHLTDERNKTSGGSQKSVIYFQKNTLLTNRSNAFLCLPLARVSQRKNVQHKLEISLSSCVGVCNQQVHHVNIMLLLLLPLVFSII